METAQALCIDRKDDSVKVDIVKIIVALSIFSSGLWMAGLGLAMKDQFFYEASPPVKKISLEDVAEEKEDGFHIVALGDSLTRGTGDDSGKGYVGYVVDELQTKTKQTIYVKNLAIKGQRSAGLAAQLQQVEVQRQIKQADVILMTIGGNDLFQSGEALRNFSLERINQAKAQYLQNLHTIFKTIRSLNPDAVVFYISLYNPFNDLKDAKTTSAVVREWNFKSAEVAANYPNIITVPTFDLFELNVNDYLYSDKFHPNKEGYKLIGQRVASLITFTEGDEKND
jgi:lysophospholipase L1-like esterase